MSVIVLQSSSAEATRRLGELLGAMAEPGDVVLLAGDLGAGKTQFVKGLAAGLGVSEPVTSPTFNILLVHEGRIPLYHVDLYRLDRAEQLEDIDYFGTLEAGGVTAVEWGDRFEEATPQGGLTITLHIVSDAERRIEIQAVGTRAERVSAELRASARGVEGLMAQVSASDPDADAPAADAAESAEGEHR